MARTPRMARWLADYPDPNSSPFGPIHRSERLPTVHCDCVSSKMAEFSFARDVFTVFLCDIFTGLES